MTGHGYAQYKRVAIETASPGQLVLRLYTAALDDLAQAHAAIAAHDGARRHQALTHAHEIICALQQGLDMQAGGPLAAELHRIYAYLRTRILDANIHKDPALLTEVEEILAPIQRAWQQAMLEQASSAAAPAAGEATASVA